MRQSACEGGRFLVVRSAARHRWEGENFDMRRRDFMLLGGAAAGWPVVARAQQAERVRRIGVLMLYPENDPEGQRRATAFQEGLQKLGWVVERNIQIDFQWG